MPTSIRLRHQQGLVLLAVLVFILVSTLAASTMVEIYKTQLQREKEQQLLFIGAQIRKAIASYYNSIPPGGVRTLPPSLEVLVNDHRFPTAVQHLRRVYLDPITGRAEWDLVLEGGGIVGVKSKSTLAPIKTGGFSEGNEHFEGRSSYSEWTFSIEVRK